MAQSAISSFPAPPDYYIRFVSEDAIPEPPAPITGPFTSFSIQGNSDVSIPPLQGGNLIPDALKGDEHIAANLSVLNKALLHALVELMDALEKTPSEIARELETVLAVQNNMMHLCNRLRITQGTSTLRYILTQSIEEKEALLKSLQECAAGVEAGIVDAATSVASS